MCFSTLVLLWTSGLTWPLSDLVPHAGFGFNTLSLCVVIVNRIPCVNIVLSLSAQMIDTVTEPGVQPFAVQVKTLMDLEARYQPKLSGLRLIETSQDNGLRMTTRLRELEVKDLLSLTRFFGFSSDTFSLAISLLDRFLSVMKVCNIASI